MPKELRFCLQHKIKWIDNDISRWHTDATADTMEHLQNDILPLHKRRDKEAKANSTTIEGYEYRIVLEMVMRKDL